jgi:hypothetical protein
MAIHVGILLRLICGMLWRVLWTCAQKMENIVTGSTVWRGTPPEECKEKGESKKKEEEGKSPFVG